MSSRPLLDEFRRTISPGISFARNDLRPDEFFHYTSASAFQQIVQGRCLRATNFRFLDDPTEVSYGLELVLPELRKQGDNTRRKVVRSFWFRTAAAVAEAALSDFYICCFSGTKDDVSQWRAYGGGPVRYSIGFDSEAFYEITKRAGGRLDSLVYKLHTQIDHVAGVVEKANKFFTQHSVREGHLDSFVRVAARQFVRLMTRFKSPKYIAEREWRIVIEKPADFSDGVCFDSSRGYLRPFIALSLASDDQPAPVRSLWVLAPGRADSAIRAAKLVLQSGKIDNVEPHASKVPIAF